MGDEWQFDPQEVVDENGTIVYWIPPRSSTLADMNRRINLKFEFPAVPWHWDTVTVENTVKKKKIVKKKMTVRKTVQTWVCKTSDERRKRFVLR